MRSSTSAGVRLLVDIGGRTGYPASVPSRRGSSSRKNKIFLVSDLGRSGLN